MNRKQPKAVNRRSFLKVTAAGTAAIGTASAWPAKSYARIIGSNQRFNVAVIGLRGRGNSHLNGLAPHVTAICDCDSRFTEQRAEQFQAKHGRQLQIYEDYRDVAASPNIDAVSIATPNHTHSIIGIEALKQGKHVYCEKPISHNVWEGRQLVNAAREYDRVVQCGTQSRSSSALRRAVKFIRDGNLGSIRYVVGTCYKPRKSIGKLDRPLEIPDSVNYDLWCGPADKVDIYRPQLHYDWHWDFNTGSGDMGNQGIHQMDIARWCLGEDRLADTTLSVGGRVGYDDAGNTPNSQIVLHLFNSIPLIFETRGLPQAKQFQDNRWASSMDNYRGSQIGVVVQCEGGHVVIPSYSQAKVFDNDGQEVRSWAAGGNHYQNFIEAAQANDPTQLNAEIEQGHLSSALCHLGNVSHLAGHPAPLAEIKQAVSEFPNFTDSLSRLLEHLEANQIDLDAEPVVLGHRLEVDPQTETIKNSSQANELLKREGRGDFKIEAIQTA